MYRKNDNNFFKHFDFMVLDIICLMISFVLSAYIRHKNLIYLKDPNIFLYRGTLLFLVIVSFILYVFQDTFKNVLKRGPYSEFIYSFRHAFEVVIAGVVYLFASKGAEEFSRVVLFLMGVIYLVITLIVRQLWKLVVKRNRASDGSRKLLLITKSEIAEDSIKILRENNYQSFKLVGTAIVDKVLTGDTIDDVPVVAELDDLVEYVCKEWIDELFIIMPEGEHLDSDVMEELNQIGVVIHIKIANESDLIGRKQTVEKLANFTVLTTSMNFATPGQLLIKRLMDIVGGAIGCVLCGIAILIVGPIIKIQSPGPIFFSQTRVGQNGKLFKVHKLRSMYMDAEERKKELMAQNKLQDAKMFKMDNDPRITPIGRFIRKTSIDELPQFFDVLVGNMSLVGTRPPLPDEVKEYEPHHHARLAIRPGITGMWQVSGRSDITDFEEVVKLDTEYINNWDLGLDIKILFKTVLVVLLGRGSV